jgi:8-oxo-dGTP diphosphatase
LIIGQKKYCHFCSASLIKKECEGSLRLFCESCDEPIYENPIPATAVVVIDNKERLLLVKRSVEPKIGHWCLPGGFMELGETPEQGALRELEEETGLIGKIDRLIDVSTSPNPFYITVVLIGYLILKHSGTLIAGDDASDVAYYSYDKLPEIAFESHKHFIEEYYSNRT